MKKVVLYSILLIIGLAGSQVLPLITGGDLKWLTLSVDLLTMIGLSYIMIHVGYEFEIDKSNLRQYGWDYVVAMTAAAFPWIFVVLYMIFVMLPPEFWSNWDAWKESLLAGRFAAPTSAGVLFSMLAAAGLGATWLFRKARILAIFDDLDTVLLMIPLKMLMVGFAWQLGFIIVVMVVMLWIAWKWMHRINISITWKSVLFYSAVIGIASELLYNFSKIVDDSIPIHIEVLLPAFVLGVIIKRVSVESGKGRFTDILETAVEKKASTIVSAVFMVLVGLNMPAIIGQVGSGVGEAVKTAGSVLATQPFPSVGMIIFHVLMITIVSNIGKMFPAFCYRKEADWRERLAVAIGMWPRGEVGAGVLVVSLGYGIGGPVVTVAMLSLALNLLLTGVFIAMVKRLLKNVPR
ncbi:MAG: sodium:proton antiporter [candidate division Zixibacteria bacterium]|nr:sodium:proton antiporter [candidate division Zixibacteria bacterium]